MTDNEAVATIAWQANQLRKAMDDLQAVGLEFNRRGERIKELEAARAPGGEVVAWLIEWRDPNGQPQHRLSQTPSMAPGEKSTALVRDVLAEITPKAWPGGIANVAV